MSRTLASLYAFSVALLAPWAVSQAPAQPKPAAATIRVVTLPITNFTPLLVAREKGYFAAENLTVTWTNVAQGAVAIEAVFGGSAEVGGSAIFETMVARGNGLDLMFLAPGVHIHDSPPDNNALLI